jgi:hypothetical protein
MSMRNEASSLIALRELRDLERRQISADAEAAQARVAQDAARLRSDLESARSKIGELRAELERARLAQLESASLSIPVRPPERTRWFGWLGVSAGTTMLVGALALSAAMRPHETRAGSLEPSAARCPAPVTSAAAEPAAPPKVGAPDPRSLPSSKLAPRPRPAPGRPHGTGKPASAKVCDGTDPLCGIDVGAIDDVGKQPRKGGIGGRAEHGR